MKLKYIFYALLIVSAAGWFTVASTETEDLLYSEVVFLRGLELGAGGRAIALGGAYRALSDDLSALYWNPAGLASVRRIELTLGLSQAEIFDDAMASDETVSNQLSRTRLNELGMVFPIPTYRGSLVFALGYHQVLSLDAFGTFNDISDEYDFSADELESGRLGLWSFGGAIDLSPNVSTGLALRLWTGYNDYSYNGVTQWPGDEWSTFDQSIDLNLSGWNVITGVLVRAVPWLRVGASIETPLKLKIEESYKQDENWFIGGDSGDYYFAGSYEYKLTRSFRAGLGIAGMIGPVILSGDAVWNDWSQISFSTEPSFEALTKDEANREITKELRSTVDLHFGAEIWIPQTPVRLQLGYARIPSPFEADETLSDKNIISGGISTLLDQAFLIQTSIAFASWERTIGGWEEDLQTTHLQLTLSYRL
jgi:hypothetical protein